MLSGINVLDLADENASYCTKILALMGARVIKIEPPGGDPARHRYPFIMNTLGQNRSLSFCYDNTNKLGITLNMSRQEGRQLFLYLIKRADVLVETFSSDELKKYKCGYKILNDINPRLIHVSVTGFGRKGCRKNYHSCDLVTSAYGGSMYVSGGMTTPPLKPGGEQSRFTASLFTVLSILLSLHRRQKKGQGVYLDLSMQEAVTATLEHVMTRYFRDNIVSTRQGSRHWNDEFCILPCQDGFIQITIFQHWEILIGLMARDGMAGDLVDDVWENETYRRSHVEHIIDIMTAWASNYPVYELFHLGQLLGFPWAPVQSPISVFKNPHLRERNFFKTLQQVPIEEAILYPSLPFRCNNVSMPTLRSAPAIGEDNIRIYHDELGFSNDDLKRLSTKGII